VARSADDGTTMAYHCTMTPGDRQEKVRAIEYTGDDPFSPPTDLDDVLEPEDGRPRPWIALVLSASAVMLVLGALSVFGSVEFADPEPAQPQDFASGAQSDAESPPETLPPRLEESLPNLTDRLTLVAMVDGTFQTLLWDPSFRVPKAYDLPIGGTEPLVDIEASFDSGGRMLAIEISTPETTQVYLGDPTDVGLTPDIRRPASLLWHASQVGALAWVMPGPNGQWDLHTGKVDPLSGTITNDLVVTSFDTPVDLVRWDTSGFVLNQGSDVVAIDPDGKSMWQRTGVAISGSTSILAIIAPDDSESDTRWVIADRISGEAVPRQVVGTPSEVWVAMSRDTDLVAEIAATETRTRIAVSGPELAATRVVQVDLQVEPIGFTSSGEYLQFDLLDSNDLVFVNWNTGATHIVPIPDNTTVIGSDLG